MVISNFGMKDFLWPSDKEDREDALGHLGLLA